MSDEVKKNEDVDVLDGERPVERSGGKLVPILIAANMLMVVGLGVIFFLVGRSGAAGGAGGGGDAHAAQDASGHGDEKTGEHKPQPSLPFEPFIVNLNEPGGTRYLKATMELQFEEDGAVSEVKSRTSEIRDLVISYLSGLTLVDTQGAAGKKAIRDEIVRRLNDQLQTGRIRNVFFTDFIIQ
jgi:flagellar FliL protein